MGSATYNIPGRRFVHPALLRRDGMQIGAVRFADGDVSSVRPYETLERDCNGQFGCSAFYGFAAAMFLIGILVGSLEPRYMIAVVFLGAVSAMSLGDAFNTPAFTMFRLAIRLKDGRDCEFVDADPAVVEAIRVRLLGAGAVELRY